MGKINKAVEQGKGEGARGEGTKQEERGERRGEQEGEGGGEEKERTCNIIRTEKRL